MWFSIIGDSSEKLAGEFLLQSYYIIFFSATIGFFFCYDVSGEVSNEVAFLVQIAFFATRSPERSLAVSGLQRSPVRSPAVSDVAYLLFYFLGE
jgi:hypothetical protein